MNSHYNTTKIYYIYIITNKYRTTFYIGITNNIKRRAYEHINAKDLNPQSFTARYNITDLIYYETFFYINNAIEREKELKGWRKSKKIALIQFANPTLSTIAL